MEPKKVLLLLETSREYGRGLLRGIARYADLYGPWIMVQQAPFYTEEAKGRGRFALPENIRYDGIVMREESWMSRLSGLKTPIVAACYRDPNVQCDCRVMTDNTGIGEQAARHFIQRGFQNFAFLGYDGMFWSIERGNAFGAAVEKVKGRFFCFVQSHPVKRRRWDVEQHDVARWLSDLPKPCALMACNDDRGRQALDACRLAGLNVPEQIAVVGVDNDEFVCSLSSPSLSSVSLDVERAGFQAAAFLAGQMEKPDGKNKIIVVEPTGVVVRQSSDVLAIEDPDVAQAVRYIRQHACRPLQVDDVLEELAISRRMLYEKFQQALGCPIHKYIKRVRIEQMEKLLLETKMSVLEIALQMGFSGADHIAQYFKKETGLNPLAFRLRHIEKS